MPRSAVNEGVAIEHARGGAIYVCSREVRIRNRAPIPVIAACFIRRNRHVPDMHLRATLRGVDFDGLLQILNDVGQLDRETKAELLKQKVKEAAS